MQCSHFYKLPRTFYCTLRGFFLISENEFLPEFTDRLLFQWLSEYHMHLHFKNDILISMQSEVDAIKIHLNVQYYHNIQQCM